MSNSKIQIGKIIAMDSVRQRVFVELAPSTADGCGGSCHCGSILSLEDKPRGPRVWMPYLASQKLTIGQAVPIATALPSAYTGILLIFVVPVVLLMTGAITANQLATKLQWQSVNLATGLGAFLGLFLALLLAVGFDFWYRRTHEVYRILDSQNCWGSLPASESKPVDCSSCAFSCHPQSTNKP